MSFEIADANIDETRTKTAERLIAPLVHLVTSLHADYCPPGRSNQDRNAVLAKTKEALDNFISVGMQIIRNHPFAVGKAWEQLKTALENVRLAGFQLLDIGAEFVKDPGNAEWRSRAVKSGQNTLMAVARLLIMADMVDVDLILRQVEKIRNRLDEANKAENTQQLLQTFTNFEGELQELTEMTKRRIFDLRDPSAQDDLQAAIALLKVTTPIIISSSKAFVRHPELEALRLNKEYAFYEMQKALDCVKIALKAEVNQSTSKDVSVSQQGDPTDLALNLEKFQHQVYMDPTEYRPNKHRPQLEELLERIASGSATFADLENTRQQRHDQIISGVNNLRQALQDLLKEYERNIGRMEPTEDLDLSKVYLAHKIRDLRRHLRRAVVDHVSDVFLDTTTPLMLLVEAAKSRNRSRVEKAANEFQFHAEKLVEVARLVSNISFDVEGVRIVRYAALLCEGIAPQVVNAAFLLCEKPDSAPIQDNMKQFETVWLERVKVLTSAMDSLISLDDFLAVTEAHVREDSEQGIQAIVEQDTDMLDQVAGCIRGRAVRVCDVVLYEMRQLPSSNYTETVKAVTQRFCVENIPKFAARTKQIINEIFEAKQRGEGVDSRAYVDQMIDTCQLIHDGVSDVRQSLLMNRNPEDVDSDNEYEEDAGTTMITDQLEVRSQVSSEDAENQQRIMRQLPQESKREIQKQIDVFKITQKKFEYEVGKWDESSNDIIALAKHMCNIMMNMMDFTKGRGPYKTTMDIIKASQEISEDGNKLNALVRQIGNECVESTTKKDLFAYLERITLFCHQLNVTSKVKADIQVVGDEMRVGLEAATSLIQNSKNLLNAVVLTVKSCYVASTKYRRKENSTTPNVVEWRMAAPHSAVSYGNRHMAKNTQGIVRKASEKQCVKNL